MAGEGEGAVILDAEEQVGLNWTPGMMVTLGQVISLA